VILLWFEVPAVLFLDAGILCQVAEILIQKIPFELSFCMGPRVKPLSLEFLAGGAATGSVCIHREAPP